MSHFFEIAIYALPGVTLLLGIVIGFRAANAANRMWGAHELADNRRTT